MTADWTYTGDDSTDLNVGRCEHCGSWNPRIYSRQLARVIMDRIQHGDEPYEVELLQLTDEDRANVIRFKNERHKTPWWFPWGWKKNS